MNWGYIGIIGYILGLYRDNGTENGNYYKAYSRREREREREREACVYIYIYMYPDRTPHYTCTTLVKGPLKQVYKGRCGGPLRTTLLRNGKDSMSYRIFPT